VEGVFVNGIMVGIGNGCSVVGSGRDMSAIDLLSIGMGTFMVCFYVLHVMRDWGVIKDKKDSRF